MLFVELALIRWAGSNVTYLSYFSNFVLLGSFLGIGLGFLHASKSRQLWPFAPLALLALVAFVQFANVEIVRTGDNLIFFGDSLEQRGLPREVVLVAVFLAVAGVMTCIADGVARTFVKFEPLEAYRLDILGSIAGILVFTLLAFLRVPPLGWGLVAALAWLVLLLPRVRLLQVVPLLLVVVILGGESFTADLSWSPYYKIEADTKGAVTKVSVNGVPHQAQFRAKHNLVYTTAYQDIPGKKLDDVLVIGAGGGNDVSAALAQGARHVDAVEIDPRLYDLGKSRHPEHPYQDPRVDVHIEDGRAYLEKTDKKYDLILLALPDSLTLLSGQSSLRLESYLFTEEAIEAARDRLAPGGVFAMYNYFRTDWLLDRYGETVRRAFGHDPCLTTYGDVENGGLAYLVASRRPSAVACSTVWEPTTSPVPEPATDDHPFPYLRDRSLPAFYLIGIALILLFSLVLVRVTAGPFRPMLRYIDLFFMGVAFLLLETKNVVQFALLFGTTWFVNALVFVGILLSVLAAVEVSKRVTFRRPGRIYLVLLASLVVAWFVPPDDLLSLAPIPRFLAAVTIAFFPIFTANLIFSQRFKNVGASATAFGANLLGAMVGGLLEYSALVVGYRALLILVAAAYGLAFFFGREHIQAGEPALVS